MKKFYFLLIALLCSATMAFAYDAEIDGIFYNLDTENKTAEVTNNGKDGGYTQTEIILPTSITYGNNTYSISSIGNGAFSNCASLTSITIPNSVTYIGMSAFRDCFGLKSIIIPSSIIKIEGMAFENCAIESVYISDLTAWCKINFGKDNYGYTSGANPLCNGANLYLNNEKIINLIIPDGVSEISPFAFDGGKFISSIVIPNSVTSIGTWAFSDCSSLSSIVIGNSVASIGVEAFLGCSSLTSIDVDENNPNYASIDGVLYDKNITTLIDCPRTKTEVLIPNSVTLIGFSLFSECSSLTSITIQAENPPTIFEYTFENVSRSISIKVPCGSKAKYQAAEYWREFINYEEVPAGILTVDVNDKTMGFATITKQNSCTDDVAQVQAQALAGYEFVCWSDGATENPHILLVTEDMTITAEFRKIGEEPEDKPGEEKKHNNFIVESADKTQGAVEITITAKAIEGFEFDHWSDGSTENPRVVTLDEDVELYAYFRVAGTGLENSVISSANVYGNNGVLYVEGAEVDYHVLDAAGRLIYSGRVAELSLPRGVYVIAVGGEVEKVVI